MKYAIALLLIAAVLVAGCIGQSGAPTASAVTGTDIIEFYGAECAHCINMKPIVEQVESDLGLTITKLEVWHDDGNRAKFLEFDSIITASCGGLGVPAFVNLKTGRAICGEKTAEELRRFITG